MSRAYGSLIDYRGFTQRVKTRCYKMNRGYASLLTLCIPITD